MTTERLDKIIGELGDEVIASEFKNTARRRRLVRGIAAAAALLIVFGAAFGVAKAAGAGWKDPQQNADGPAAAVPKDAVLPPARIGTEGNIHSVIRGPLTIGSAKEESIAVCVLTIGDWIGEDDDETFFDAKVEKVICGELPEHITLCQHGNSKWTSKGFPLLTYGDRLLAFLRDVTWNDEQPDNCYTFTGVKFTHFFIEKANDGREYAIDISGVLSHYSEREKGFHVKNHSEDIRLIHELITSISGYDELLSDWLNDYLEMLIKDNLDSEISVRVYELSELEQYIIEVE